MTEELVEKYSNYIYGIAKSFSNYPKEDIIQAGFLGLIKAYKNYVPCDTKFTTYAFNYVKGEMYKVIKDEQLLKVSYDTIKAKRKVNEVKEVLSQKLMREPTLNEISSFTDLDIKTIEYLMQINTNTSSLDKINNEINLYDVIPSEYTDLNTLIALKDALNKLDEKDLKILSLSLSMSEKTVGEIMDMNQVKVSRTLKKIKNSIKENMQ